MRRPLSLLSLVILVLALAPPRADARGELKEIRRVLVATQDPKRRLAQIPKLVAVGEPGGAVLLEWLVRHDPTLAVRVGAAAGLGRIRTENAPKLLVSQLRRGGPRVLRETLAASLARHGKEGAREILRAADMGRVPLVQRILLLDAMGHLEDDSTRERLQHFTCDATAPDLQSAALRALARRQDDVAARTVFFVRLLGDTKDPARLRELLDVLEPSLHRAMLPSLKRLEAHEDAGIAAAAAYLLERLPRHDPLPVRLVPPEGGDPDDRYAKQDPPFEPTLDIPPPPPPPSDGRREDVVYVFDATGSAMRLVQIVKNRVSREVAGLTAAGVHARVGLVLYRGGHGRGARSAGIETLPLTADLDRVRDFLASVDTRGADDRGAALTEGLREGLDLMSWRWNARRRVQVVADSGCDDVETTKRRVAAHYRADRTRTAFAYVLRTRTRIPDEFEALAKSGGTGGPEGID